jgi:hypothetical protein
MTLGINPLPQRWLHICQDCWQAQNPDQYCPDLNIIDTCNWCSQEAVLVIGVRSVKFIADEFTPPPAKEQS